MTILGSSLEDASSVVFGTYPATRFTVNASGTRIIADAPAETAGVVDVTVKTPAGTSAISSSDKYTYLGPMITMVSPASGTAGTMVTIVGSDLNGTSSVMFGNVSAGTVFSVTNAPHRVFGTEIVVYAPAAGPGTVDISVTTPGGTSETSALDQFTYSGASD